MIKVNTSGDNSNKTTNAAKVINEVSLISTATIEKTKASGRVQL